MAFFFFHFEGSENWFLFFFFKMAVKTSFRGINKLYYRKHTIEGGLQHANDNSRVCH